MNESLRISVWGDSMYFYVNWLWKNSVICWADLCPTIGSSSLTEAQLSRWILGNCWSSNIAFTFPTPGICWTRFNTTGSSNLDTLFLQNGFSLFSPRTCGGQKCWDFEAKKAMYWTDQHSFYTLMCTRFLDYNWEWWYVMMTKVHPLTNCPMSWAASAGLDTGSRVKPNSKTTNFCSPLKYCSLRWVFSTITIPCRPLLA